MFLYLNKKSFETKLYQPKNPTTNRSQYLQKLSKETLVTFLKKKEKKFKFQNETYYPAKIKADTYKKQEMLT